MSFSKQNETDFMAKMKEKAAAKPAAPLALLRSEPAPAVAPTPAPTPAKKKATFETRTMSFRLAESDYDAIEDVIFKRKKAGERSLSNQDAGREMVALWLRQHGVKPYDYKS